MKVKDNQNNMLRQKEHRDNKNVFPERHENTAGEGIYNNIKKSGENNAESNGHNNSGGEAQNELQELKRIMNSYYIHYE